MQPRKTIGTLLVGGAVYYYKASTSSGRGRRSFAPARGLVHLGLFQSGSELHSVIIVDYQLARGNNAPGTWRSEIPFSDTHTRGCGNKVSFLLFHRRCRVSVAPMTIFIHVDLLWGTINKDPFDGSFQSQGVSYPRGRQMSVISREANDYSSSSRKEVEDGRAGWEEETLTRTKYSLSELRNFLSFVFTSVDLG